MMTVIVFFAVSAAGAVCRLGFVCARFAVRVRGLCFRVLILALDLVRPVVSVTRRRAGVVHNEGDGVAI